MKTYRNDDPGGSIGLEGKKSIIPEPPGPLQGRKRKRGQGHEALEDRFMFIIFLPSFL